MPYPLAFRPNTLANLYDQAGALVTPNANCQVFRPLIGCQFNESPPDADPWLWPGGTLLRFSIEDATWGALFFGPSNWQLAGVPFFRLTEDPNGENWYVLDAVPWIYSSGLIVQGTASKRHALPDMSSTLALPAGGVAASYTGPLLRFGVMYAANMPPGYDKWFVLPTPAEIQGFTWQCYSSSAFPTVPICQLYQGPQEGPTSIVTSGATGRLIVGIAHVGAHGLIRFQNTTANDTDVLFAFERMVTPNRD